MKNTEIEKIIIELCDMATAFYSKANPKVTEVVELLGDAKNKISEADWNATKDSVDAYADGMNLVMSGLFDYVHRKVANSDATE